MHKSRNYLTLWVCIFSRQILPLHLRCTKLSDCREPFFAWGKGQLISKCLFWRLQFSQKTKTKNKNKQFHLRYHSSKVESFRSFFGRIEDSKRHFHIKDWPGQKVTIYYPIFYLVKCSENILFFYLHFT